MPRNLKLCGSEERFDPNRRYPEAGTRLAGAPPVPRRPRSLSSRRRQEDLGNPADKRQIHCDHKLKTIFDGKETVGFLEIGKLLSRHFVKLS
ncbi:hypothetical protein RJ639_044798 [Escallonia herrerae]|uniref:DM2 domain-containing protein n=1 Tax=Escallonia herrerae TaxID=1293975 RepID=A0AA88WCA7_9ASTE|nr:hypothetical protein RJ639_044798 [Escallonia herrerae]